MADRYKNIQVYSHWEGMEDPVLMGELSASEVRGKEVFSFTYDNGWLQTQGRSILDPALHFYSGPQYLNDEKPNFGVFTDSSPDRWGRMLIKRREALRAREGKRPERRLLESDFLLGVHDGSRMGALRFKTDPNGPFLDSDQRFATPPWTSLRQLESASLNLQDENSSENPSYSRWLDLLVAPGSSLGGARPKASVLAPDGTLWIAKFPGKSDAADIGLWEMLTVDLAKKCGIGMAESRCNSFTSAHHTFLTKRFDRSKEGTRIHFASAMTMLGYSDGADAASGVSYLEIAAFLVRHGAEPEKDLRQLWKRIVFSIAVSNTDDHLRNHGFLLTPEGCRLSPAFDINPDPEGYGLSLNISENDNSLNAELALETAPFYRITTDKGRHIIDQIRRAVAQWSDLARRYRIPHSEQEQMARAFSRL